MDDYKDDNNNDAKGSNGLNRTPLEQRYGQPCILRMDQRSYMSRL
jgi:hypothetical protein